MTVIEDPGVGSLGNNSPLISPPQTSEELPLVNETTTSMISNNTDKTEGFVGTLYSGFASYSDAIIVSIIVMV